MSAISSLASSSGSTGSTSGNGFADLSSAEFLNVIMSELQNQDPLAPNDSSKLMEQLSSIRNIESQFSLQKSLEDLVLQNQLASASALIGKVVTGLDESGDKLEGQVTSVKVQEGKAYLELDTGKSLPLTRLTEVADAAPAASASGQ